jgi:hypothetical protein
MTANPFKSTGTQNLADMPMTQTQRDIAQQQRSAPVGDHTVAYDPATKSGTPATQALLDHLAKQRAGELKMVINSIAKKVAPLENRIVELEAALDVERAKVAGAIETALVGYLGDEQPTKGREPTTEDIRKHNEYIREQEAKNV